MGSKDGYHPRITLKNSKMHGETDSQIQVTGYLSMTLTHRGKTSQPLREIPLDPSLISKYLLVEESCAFKVKIPQI